MKKNKVYELANLLKILFMGYKSKDDNKVLKAQLKSLLSYKSKVDDVINGLINEYDCFNNSNENWEWFKFKALDIINENLYQG